METNTNTSTFTHTRMDTIIRHFHYFLKIAEMEENTTQKLLNAAMRQELDAAAIYLEKDGMMIAEVEFRVNWTEYNHTLSVSGPALDTSGFRGWKNCISPEAVICVEALLDYAQKNDLKVRSWISVSRAVRNDPEKHKAVCNDLGYEYGSTVAPWPDSIAEEEYKIHHLEECSVFSRNICP